MKEELNQIRNILQEGGLRVTKARVSVSEALIQNKNNFLSSEEIYLKIKQSKKVDCDQVSVYRILTKFEELGIVSKTNFQGEAARFQISINSESQKTHSHKHYFKCLRCHKVEPFSECVVARKENELSAKGYTNLSHHLEITGLCPSCAA